ncbi:RodZ domain-containing protein [Shewanella woodyi]|uniref:Cytoskeleton protein RodZ-like C-terminal domain-containing protein n=1 Tax=Shewanella woodyi (strain ATCC 51908 / MS32) TaxID=392500 RepID=B1KKJ1_SHEWM|nr:RodZ domain-containing protein [Shewanella woodyi]ACA85831.1 conserved hypothetical protein [Shewanella woodyi ATCC 51908]
MTNKKVDMLKDAADSNETPDISEQMTLGSLLKAAREEQGASIGDIAGQLHLRPCIVEDIEADNFGDIASAIYVKGYVKNYARIVQADAQAIQACLDIQLPKASAPEMQSFSRKTTRQARDGRLMFVTYLIAFILLALLVLWWVQKSDTQASVDFSKPTMEEMAESIQEPFSTKALPDPTLERDSGIESSGIESSDTGLSINNSAINSGVVHSNDIDDLSPETVNVESSDLATTVVSTEQLPVSVQSEIVQDLPSVDSLGASRLSLSLVADCWINVKDADGKVLINDLKKAGSLLEVKGREPFKLTLGAPQAVTIKLNEESISLADYANGRVARFSLPFAE